MKEKLTANQLKIKKIWLEDTNWIEWAIEELNQADYNINYAAERESFIAEETSQALKHIGKVADHLRIRLNDLNNYKNGY